MTALRRVKAAFGCRSLFAVAEAVVMVVAGPTCAIRWLNGLAVLVEVV